MLGQVEYLIPVWRGSLCKCIADIQTKDKEVRSNNYSIEEAQAGLVGGADRVKDLYQA